MPRHTKIGLLTACATKGFAEEVEAQHTALAHQGCDLMRALESVIRGQDLSWELETLS